MGTLLMICCFSMGLTASGVYANNIRAIVIGLAILIICANYFLFERLYNQINELYSEIQSLKCQN